MNQLLGDLDYVTIYIGDFLIIQKDDEPDLTHLERLAKVLDWLEKAGFKANLMDFFFVQEEIEYLGYLLTALQVWVRIRTNFSLNLPLDHIQSILVGFNLLQTTMKEETEIYNR